MRKSLLLILGWLLLFALEILRVYFIMPFPGSQRHDTIGLAYFLDRNILWLRLVAWILVIVPLLHYLRKGRVWQKIVLIVVALLYAGIFYLFNFRFLADKMFYQPRVKQFAVDSTQKDRLVIGVALNGEARAYPIGIIGYHHQVRDTVGGQPIMVTYCTVCRTGRVYSPVVQGAHATFRLVGMDHFNAMFEDADTHSWWQQATGVAVAGPLKGQRLAEVPSAQMTLGDWQALHPNSLTMQPDSNFQRQYAGLKAYDDGTIKSSLEHRDTGSWQFKSWVVGVVSGGRTKAYDWNSLVRDRVIVDTALLLTIEPNNRTFHVFAFNDSLRFRYDPATGALTDLNTHSTWRMDGTCMSGPLKGTQLPPVQAYQEFWHSWRTFHPGTAMRY